MAKPRYVHYAPPLRRNQLRRKPVGNDTRDSLPRFQLHYVKAVLPTRCAELTDAFAPRGAEQKTVVGCPGEACAERNSTTIPVLT